MPTKPQQRFTAWSFSRWNDYVSCPLKAKFKHLDKLKEPENKAMARGNAVDGLAEKYSTGQLQKIPEELKLFKEEFGGLRKIKKVLKPQQNIAVTSKWLPTGWFDSDAWLRVKMDVFYDDLKKGVRKIIDYKTGKIREEHKLQLDLYAVGGLPHAGPTIKTIETELWYLDQGHIEKATYTRAEAEALREPWEDRVAPMLRDTAFKPVPGVGCQWCHFGQKAKKEKGGPGLCKF